MNAYQLTGIEFQYGERPVLQDIALTVPSGDFLGLIGPNSSGKSTLLKLLSGVISPSAGTLTLLERPFTQWPIPERAKNIAVVSSEDYFVFPYTVEHIVLMGRTPYTSWSWSESPSDRAIAQSVMKRTDLLHLKDRSIHELSSGERQRVLLARALAQQPKVLLLDEPTAHLDIGHEWSLFQLLADLHREQSLTIICAVHDLTLASAFCKRLVCLQQGQLQAVGTPEEVLTPTVLSRVFETPMHVEWRNGSHLRHAVLSPQISHNKK